MKRILILLIGLSLLQCKRNSAPTIDPPVLVNTFTNPLLSSGPDPWIVKKDSFYYYTHTLGNRIDIWKTKSVSALKQAAIKTAWIASASGPNSKNVWAPEMHHMDGKWYLYYTAGATNDLSTQRTFVLENASADPLEGAWIDKGQIGDITANFFSIDGSVLTGYKGKNYFLWSGHPSSTDNTQHIYIALMKNAWTLQTPRSLISSPQLDWENKGAPPGVNEGPEILINPAGKIFLIYSASGCWTDDYTLGMLTLKDGGDPLNAADWIKTNTPVFKQNPANNAYGPGHNSFFKSKDGKEDWIIYHANSYAGQGCGDARNPRIQKFLWNADGTPDFGEPVKVNAAINKPSGE